MPSHKSAKKRVRRNDRVRLRNRHYLSTVRTTVKKFIVAVEGLAQGNAAGKDKDAAGGDLNSLLVSAQSVLAKAASKGLMKKNTASRKIGRLATFLQRTQAAVAAGGEGTAAAGQKKSAGGAKKKKTTTKTKTTAKGAAKKTSKKKATKSSK